MFIGFHPAVARAFVCDDDTVCVIVFSMNQSVIEFVNPQVLVVFAVQIQLACAVEVVYI